MSYRSFSLRSVFLSMLIVMMAAPASISAAQVVEKFDVRDGIRYTDTRYDSGSANQAIRVLEIDTGDSRHSVDIGLSPRLNQLQRTTTLAKSLDNPNGEEVVGAINASFFHAGAPMNLISKDNELVHAGEVFPSKDTYVNEPIAFGVNAQGDGVIDHYALDLDFVHSGKRTEITSTNKVRAENEMILYTPYFPGNTTETNKWGKEVIVTLPDEPDLEFGSTVTGTVEYVREPGDATESVIPDNGFVLSAHGQAMDDLSGMKEGDNLKLQVDVDSKWLNSEFMLASGPMLVKDGRVSLSMNPSSNNASIRAPRTAVAIDDDGEKIYFITVDGRQAGYSNGMNLTEFATYLKDLGVERALNLDGGGSTTMAVEYPGEEDVQLANKPSDGWERSVSAILMATTTAPRLDEDNDDGETVTSFIDVPKDHWAYSPVMNLSRQGVLNGYPDKTFRPSTTISREHAAIMLSSALDLDTANTEDPGFADVDRDYKYYAAIAAVENAGLFSGRGDNEFVPQDNLTRAEMAVVLQKAYQIAGTTQSYFPDVADSHWASYSINSIAAAGIAGGYSDGTYGPNNNVTRAEFSTFLMKAQ